MSTEACPTGSQQDVSGGGYAIGILKIREIIERTAITRLPSMPISVRGIINLRGKVSSVSGVLDLGERDVEPPPAFGARIRANFLKGMGNSGQQFVLPADVDKLLCSTNLLVGAIAVVSQAEHGQSTSPAQPLPSSAAAHEKPPAWSRVRSLGLPRSRSTSRAPFTLPNNRRGRGSLQENAP